MTQHTRKLAVATFKDERTARPTKTGTLTWEELRLLHSKRSERQAKSGPMLAGIAVAGERRNENVTYRSFLQLDVDSAGEKDKTTGRLLKVTRAAPTLDSIRAAISEYEWFANSTHWHEPARGVIKYRVTILTDRDVLRNEYAAVLEALDDRLSHSLDRAAWAWSQAFYRPSCPPENVGQAFFEANEGEPLPVDQFVARGREIIQARGTQIAPPGGSARAAINGIEDTDRSAEIVKAMLAVIPANLPRSLWRDIVWSVAATALPDAECYARDWSMSSPGDWDPNEFADVWASYDAARTDAVRVSTLERAASAQGYTGPFVTRIERVDGKGADVANGKRFAAMWRRRLMHIHETGEWLQFQPLAGWLATPPLEHERAAKEVLAELKAAAAMRLNDGEEEGIPRKLLQLIEYTSRSPNQRAMIEMAKSEPGMTVRLCEFDADPLLLGVANGVLDLRHRRLLSVSPDIMVSKRCPMEFDPAAHCPIFERFMRDIQPADDIRGFLQRWVGYCLTGTVSEQKFVFMYGSGGNGKSVLIELVAWLLGDYARKIATEMLMHHQRNPQGPSPDIVALKGVRLAYANETEEGRRLADARVKELTGGDTLTGRVPYGKADISFRPSQKLVLAGNHRPDIADTSNGMWRRVLLVGFDEVFDEGRRDPDLLAKLKLEGSGILNWALEGLRQWQKGGLAVPQAIAQSTDAYRQEQDIIGEWILDTCDAGRNCSARKPDLYRAYRSWCEVNGHMPCGQSKLTRRLNERGYQLQSDRRSVRGLSLKGAAPLDPAGA